MKKYFKVLRQCPLFYWIEDESLIKMIQCLGAKIEIFDKKYTIMAEGTPAKYVGIVLSGSAQIIQIDYYGNRSILGSIRPSEIFAEAFACAEVSSIPVTVIANEPCEVMLIDCNHILHTCSNNCGFHQQLIFNLMKDLATKTLLMNQKLEIISKRSTRDKLMAYLMFQAKKAKSNSFDIPFDRQELADYLEVNRSGLSVEISKLRDEGILDSHRKHFELFCEKQDYFL
ncbi:MAG: Crp/Fnr family transcriptional regulator [Lachnospiraceae bacterium]|nr:Crp/Fnr family transcriptional regulator [Lachnospiraceae bacterium]